MANFEQLPTCHVDFQHAKSWIFITKNQCNVWHNEFQHFDKKIFNKQGSCCSNDFYANRLMKKSLHVDDIFKRNIHSPMGMRVQ